MEAPFWDQNDSSNDSLEGTAVHECGEILLPIAMANWDQEDKFEGAPTRDSKTFKKYTDQQIEGGKRYCLDILRILGGKAPHVAWVSEQRFTISEALELGGTADCAWGYMQKLPDFVSEWKETFPELVSSLESSGTKELKVGGIWDYKNGTIAHDARNSDQIRQYCAGLQNKLGKAPKRPFDVIFGFIYGPNFRNQNLVQTVVAFTAPQIEEILNEQIQIAEEALGMHGEDKIFLAAGDHCFWCKGKAVCEKFDRHVKQHASSVLDAFDAKVEASRTPLLAPVPHTEVDFKAILNTKNDEQIKDFWLHIEYFEKAISATKQYIIERSKNGKPVAGLKCVPSTTRRKYRADLDDKEIGEYLQKNGVEKPWQRVTRNLTDIEKELTDLIKKNEGLKAKEAGEKAKKVMADVVERTTPGISIALDTESDDRPRIEVVQAADATKLLDANPL